MRDSKRIRKFCNMLADYWETVPDWRFGQLVSNVCRANKVEDLFFIEDDKMMDMIQKFFSEGDSI